MRPPTRRLNFANGEFSHYAQTPNDIKPEFVPAPQSFRRPDHSNMMSRQPVMNPVNHDLSKVINDETI